MASIQMPQKRNDPDPLEKLLTAVNVARTVYGIHAQSKELELAKEKNIADKARAEADAKRQGVVDEKTNLEVQALKEDANPNSPIMAEIRKTLGKRGITLPEGTTPKQARTAFDAYLRPNEAKQKDPVAQAFLEEKRDAHEREFDVPGFGKAQTKEDAKILKNAVEMKSKFDRQIDEMISLREKHGAEVLDRSAVARGRQLSKDLLLTYKNLAKLGVLSQADEAIINAIIPADPLEANSSLLGGDDPILTQLKSFKSDSDNQFATSLNTRLIGGAPQSAAQGKVKVSNGKETLMIDPTDLKDAMADGFKQVK